MTNRRTFMRAGGLVAGGLAVGAVVAESARADSPGADLPLLTWHAALAGRRWAPAVIAVLGSSTSEGVGVSAYGRGYPHLLADNLRTAFPGGGSGDYVAAWGTTGIRDWPVVTSGGQRIKTAGWGLKSLIQSAGQTATHRFQGTGVQVWFAAQPGGGRFAVTIDGVPVGAPVRTDAAATDRDARWTSPALPRGEHTIVVTCLTGPVGLHGFATVDGDNGIRLVNGGHGGRTSGDFADGAASWAPRLRTVQPHLVILQLGVNDWRINVPAETMKTNFKSIIAAVRRDSGTSPSFVIYGSPRVSAGRPDQDFARFTQAWQEVADEDTGGPGGGSAVAYFDLAARQLSPAADNSLRLYNDDRLHVTDRGAAFTADALATFLSP
ncbi:GDSL-type esterase/lipase family protein [Actinoplanes sp. G11-F43]|uniref:GDSL-type esterase/lipase family protein n=1 Tax=Actinoplanes sp. G11-F43 TaxID=3424130 RepID=UPI003D3463F3